MFRKLKMLWQDAGLMKDVVEKLAMMVNDAEYVASRAWEVCAGQAVAEATEKPLKEHDKNINRTEREVRRLTLEHLGINPGQDASGCLAVMLIAKDLERMGDHGTNMFAVAKQLRTPFHETPFFEPIQASWKALAPQFGRLERAIRDSDEEVANEVLDHYQAIKKGVKETHLALLQSDAPASQAVPAMLINRYLRRMNAHMGNAATGVIFPLENIDFVSRGLKQAEKDS